ncbi:MAG TPA: hypothetical protein VNO21_19985 [Polyangiaceae bacterium]|nr:hypothetical protein [Polyangiaceae bacterium]
MRTELPGSKPLGVHADVRAISSRGELAMLLDPQFLATSYTRGTLARMRIGGGAPRALLQNALGADWGPSGDELAAVIRSPDGYRIEYPLGTVRFKGEAIPGDIRVSPRGDRLAFVFHRDPADDAGSIAIIEGSAPPRDLTAPLAERQGIGVVIGRRRDLVHRRGQSKLRALLRRRPRSPSAAARACQDASSWRTSPRMGRSSWTNGIPTGRST